MTHSVVLSGLARFVRIEGYAVFVQVEADAIGLVGGVDGGYQLALTALQGTLFGLRNSWTSHACGEAHLEEHRPAIGMPALGDLAAAAPIATVILDGIKADQSPHLIGVIKASRVGYQPRGLNR